MDTRSERVPTSMTSAVDCRSSTVTRRVPSTLAARPLTVLAMVPTYRGVLRSTRSIPRGVGTNAIVRPAFTTGAVIGGVGKGDAGQDRRGAQVDHDEGVSGGTGGGRQKLFAPPGGPGPPPAPA